jgi:hypothetical protein
MGETTTRLRMRTPRKSIGENSRLFIEAPKIWETKRGAPPDAMCVAAPRAADFKYQPALHKNRQLAPC